MIVIDLPARLGEETRRALLIAGKSGGIVLLPVTPSGVDVRAQFATIELLREVQELYPALKGAIVRNRWKPRLKLTSEVEQGLAGIDMPTLEALLTDRTAYSSSLTGGLNPVDSAVAKTKAEIVGLADEVLAMCGGQS